MNDENKPYIDFQHVCKAFGEKVVLDDVSFDVMPGETVCILGRSGVGKSVALHHIMGFLRPDSGSRRYFLVNVSKASMTEVDGVIGYQPATVAPA